MAADKPVRAARVGDYRHAVSVELDEDEFVPYRRQLHACQRLLGGAQEPLLQRR